MTAEELETVFALLLSAGTFATNSLWYGTSDGMLAFYNGGETEQMLQAETDTTCFRIVYGNPDSAVFKGSLQVKMPPETLAVFVPINGTENGVEKKGILYTTPIAGGTIRCADDAMAAQYIFYNGKPELIRLYVNGDTVLDGDGEIRFFRWDAMKPM